MMIKLFSMVAFLHVIQCNNHLVALLSVLSLDKQQVKSASGRQNQHCRPLSAVGEQTTVSCQMHVDYWHPMISVSTLVRTLRRSE